jgi:hypothetical protein
VAIAKRLVNIGIPYPLALEIERQLDDYTEASAFRLINVGMNPLQAELLAAQIDANAGITPVPLVRASMSPTVATVIAKYLNSAPTITVAPVITGTPEVSEVLTSDGGTATGVGVITKTYKWYRDGVAIAGATSATYTLVSADEDAEITNGVVATNAYGSSAESISNALGPVTA